MTTKPTRVEKTIALIKNNKIYATLIVVGLIIISFSKVTESFDTTLRIIGLRKSFNINESSERGQFSAQLVENAWNRMFWIRVYSERVRLKAPQDEQIEAWKKYIDASEIWSSRIMNYYMGLDLYYANSGKREILEAQIQPKFIDIGIKMRELKYKFTFLDSTKIVNKVDSIQNLVDNINTDFYTLIDQKETNK